MVGWLVGRSVNKNLAKFFFSLSGLSTRQLREVLLQLRAVDVTLSVIHDVICVIQGILNETGGNLDGAQAALEGVQVIDANEDIPEEDSKCMFVLICEFLGLCVFFYCLIAPA